MDLHTVCRHMPVQVRLCVPAEREWERNSNRGKMEECNQIFAESSRVVFCYCVSCALWALWHTRLTLENKFNFLGNNEHGALTMAATAKRWKHWKLRICAKVRFTKWNSTINNGIISFIFFSFLLRSLSFVRRCLCKSVQCFPIYHTIGASVCAFNSPTALCGFVCARTQVVLLHSTKIEMSTKQTKNCAVLFISSKIRKVNKISSCLNVQ